LSRYSSMSILELIRACAETNDGEAWEEFVARFERPIALSIKRTAGQYGMEPLEFVEDLRQETYLKLWADDCRRLLEFSEQHPDDVNAVLRYIKKIAINVALDHFKSLHCQKRGGRETDQWLDDFDPAARSDSHGGSEGVEREVLLKQIDRALQHCAAGANQERDCPIFWLYYQQGMTTREIAALPTIELTEEGAESLIFRLKRCVKEQLVGGKARNPAES
jgi:RNA polymerase sigma-70 factor (ECF subfamily)